MLKSLGWQGKGLGSGERGIQEPVRPAESKPTRCSSHTVPHLTLAALHVYMYTCSGTMI